MNQQTNTLPQSGGWLLRLIKGLLVGIGAILPGLSGGVLAVIFGIYRPMIAFLSNPFKNLKDNIRFFFPIGIGGLLGVFLFSIFVKKAFGIYAAQFVCLFLGFVIGTFPSLYRQAGEEGRSTRDLVVLGAAAIFIFVLMLFGQHLPKITPNPVVWAIAGSVVALGFIVPGMSPSNFLIYFGLYDQMAKAISDFELSMLIPFMLGAILCILLFSKLAARLFQKHYSTMYHFILGTVVGSTFGILPAIVFPAFTPEGLAASGLSLPVSLVFAIVMTLIGIVISYQFSKLEERVEEQRRKEQS